MFSTRMLSVPLLLLAALMPCSATEPVKLSDAELRARIVGVWYGEGLPQITQHISQRSEYRSDGTCVSDHRISSPGRERYVRVLGTWKVSDGVFSETKTAASDPKIKIPTLTRHVLALDADHMLLVSLDESHRAEFWRGKAKPSTGKLTAVLPKKKAFLADLMSMHMGGFHSVPADAGRVSWTLDSCLLQQAAIH